MKYSDREIYFEFERVAEAILNNKKEIIHIENRDDNTKEDYKYVGDYLSNNGLDKDNPGYDEYNVIVLRNVDPDKEDLFLNYHNLPFDIAVGDTGYYNILFNRIIRHNQIDGRSIFTMHLSLDGLTINSDAETGELNTGTVLDEDRTLIKLNKTAIKLMSDIKEIKDNLDEAGSLVDTLHNVITQFRDRVFEKQDGSFIINDELTQIIDDEEEEPIKDGKFHFTNVDFNNLETGDSDEILNKGANSYTVGDYKNAFPYYLASALMGNDQAISNLGYCFMYGRSVEKNFDLALACFRIAAQKHNIDACYKLATIYRYDENYKDLETAKQYFISAFQYIVDNSEYIRYGSLCYNVAKEKISGEIFEKDVNGAYLLLLLAKRSYEADLEEGFMPHEKQYLAVKNLLEDRMFDFAKKNYKDGDENCYVFSVNPLDIDEFKKPEYFKEYDKIITLYDKFDDVDKILIPAGSYGNVLEISENLLLVEVAYEDTSCVLTFRKENVKLLNHVNLNRS